MKTSNHLKPIVIAVLTAYANQGFAADTQSVELDTVEVVNTTPLKGVGLPIQKVPAAVQVVKEKDLLEQKSLSISDFINQNLTGVNINEIQNNPYQPDVNFRGFTASPLLGTPQGLSVFVDGVRVNEPFGDVVNWDLIPMNSIQSISLVPGSNPLFGLNTLGGALNVQTKNGRTHQGGAVEAYTGSWERRAVNAEYGGVSEDGSKDYFISGNSFSEDGWRDFSPSHVNQIFGKVGWQNEKTSMNLSLTLADNKLVGNGLAPGSFLRSQGYDSILTRPDVTENNMAFLNFNWSHYLRDDIQLSGNLFYRNARTRTLNGDGNDDFELAPGGLADNNNDCLANNDADENCSGAVNRTRSKRVGYGFTSQATFTQDVFGLKNQFISGLGYDHGKTHFTQNTEYGLINATRGVDGLGFFNDIDEQVNLKGISKTWSLFATNTLSLSDKWHLTTSARYNTTKVDNNDKITPSGPDSLSGNHTFNRLNPAIGVNYTPSKALTAYASYNEGSRAPTAIELGCANEAIGCRLPNAFAGDPPLDQVVTKTFEGGLRGQFDTNIGWALNGYRSENHDDIQFISSNTTGLGFFENVGKTRRQGIDASIFGRIDAFSWSMGYSFVHATYQSQLFIASETNSSAQDFDGNGSDEIRVKKGDNIPGIPRHQLKLRVAYDMSPSWSVGSNIFAFSDQYARGNENNQHQGNGAKISGYAIVNLDSRYTFGNGWQVFAKLNNVFDREYYTAGLLGEHRFDASTGSFTGNETSEGFFAPGAPRAGWIGARYEFGGRKSSATLIDKD